MDPHRSSGDRDPVDQLIASSREMRQDERYAEALAAVGRARSLRPSRDQLRYLDAEEARLCYYLGLFVQGRDLAVRVAQGPNDVASARALVARSVNALALNQGSEALAAANDALLRLRVVRATSYELVDAQIQLTHVLANTGRHTEAIANARSCVHLARESAEGELARTEYALGFALAYAGDDEAIDRLLAAEGATRRSAGALWNWIVFCLAAYLRDRGFLQGAADFLSRSSVALRHERSWFAYRAGDMTGALRWLLPPTLPDERPFARTVLGAIRLHRRTPRGARAAAAAAREFGDIGLDHWRWGAMWINLGSTTPGGQEGAVRALLDELAARGVSNWGFYDPVLTGKILRRSERELRGNELSRKLLTRAERSGASKPPPELNVLLEALHLLNPECLLILTEAGLTTSEIRTILRALQTWLRTGEIRRSDLASALGLQESSVRAQFGRIRSKLGLHGRRGFEPILLWLAERDLLSPSTASIALQRLAAR
jgi:DNA-binding CsgD family transcriptional regulator